MKIKDEELIEAVKASKSIFDVLRYFNLKLAGGSHYHYSKRIKNLGVDTSHFTGSSWNKGKTARNKKSKEEILVKRTSGIRQKSHQLKRAMIESNIKYVCSKCFTEPIWCGSPLTLDIDHINENWLDDRLENLRFLCPNCHSQFSRNLL